MSSCSCSPDSLVSVTFGNGTAMLRCLAHETQRWLVDGRPVAVPIAIDGLRSLFVEQRGVRAARRSTRAERVIRLPQSPPPSAATADPGRVDDASLTALLHARGLSGSWAVA